jgi:hypothetical protein
MRGSRLAGFGLAVFVMLFLLYAVAQLREHAAPDPSAAGPLQVRADLMRGQPCHVADDVIMGECTLEQIRTLQREAQMRTPSVGGR